ncbi:unnamed protein product [Closterium sp. NIES-53]
MVQYRPPSARASRFSQRAQWRLHLGIERNYNACKIFDIHFKETVAACDVIFYERLTLPTYLANLEEDRDPTSGFRGDRHFAPAVDEADWDKQNVDNASEEAGPLPYCSVPIPMNDENPRESVNAETYFDFADTGYVTPAEVNTNEAECIGPNFLPDPESGDEAAYLADTTLPRYTQSGLQILGLVTAVHGTETPKEPATVQQALGGEHREKWREAMDKELKALEERNTWKVVPIGVARNKTILTGKWVFRVKTKADGTIDKFKARWVVRGFDQEHGRDFTETFAPVSRHTSLRILLAIAAMKKKKLRQIDVANAFLYALVDAEIYVELPHGSHGEPNQVDAVEPVEVAADSSASRGAEPGCAESGGAASGGATLEGAEPGGAGSGGAEPGGAEPGGAGSGGAEPERSEPWGTASVGADPGAAGSGGVEPARAGPGGPSGALSCCAAGAGGAASAGGSAATGGAGAGRATGGAGAGRATGAGPGGSTCAGGAGATGLGGARTGGTGAAGPAGAPSAGAGGATGVGATGGPGAGAAVSVGGTAGAGAAGGTGAGGAAGVGADAGGAGVVPAGSGGAARLRPYFVLLLEQVLGLPPSSGPSPSLECPPPVQSESQLQLASPLPAPSPFAGPIGGLAERREHESRPASPVRTARTSRRVPRPLPPAVPGTHHMTLRPSTAPQRVPLPSPPASSLPALANPASDSLRAAIPTVTRLLATVVTDPLFESTAASALVTELVEFAAHSRLDFATSLVAESASVCPPSVGGERALSTDVLEDRQEEFQCFAATLPHLVSTLLAPEGDPDAPDIPTPRSYAEAIEGPYSSQWQAAMDAEMASWKSTGTYVVDVPPPGANIISGMWIFRGVDYFQTFSPTPKMTTLWVLLHVTAQRDYELHSLDFSTAFLQGSLHEEIWLRRPPGFTGSFPAGTQWSLRRPVYSLRQAPREWHDTLRTTLAALGFAPSTAHPSLFLRTDTLLPPFYILVYVDDLVFATADIAGLAHVKSELQERDTCTDLGELRSSLGLHITRDRAQRTITLTQSHMVQQVLQRFDFTYSSPQATPLSTRHSLSALPSDESVEPSGPYPELVGCLITSGLGLVLGGRSPVVLTGHADASWVDDLATQRSSQGYTFSLGSGSVSWRSTRSFSVLSSSCEAEIYAGAMAAQELRWLTYLLTDLGEPPRSPPVLYVDNKAMLALCREHRLEHRTKHIALRYLLARELQQRGQLCLAYVASQANTADIFTKALQPCDHQRFCTMLDLTFKATSYLLVRNGLNRKLYLQEASGA